MEHLQTDPELTTEKKPLESYILIAKGYEELFLQMPNEQKNGENIWRLVVLALKVPSEMSYL